jgi:hypothetical protein
MARRVVASVPEAGGIPSKLVFRRYRYRLLLRPHLDSL